MFHGKCFDARCSHPSLPLPLPTPSCIENCQHFVPFWHLPPLVPRRAETAGLQRLLSLPAILSHRSRTLKDGIINRCDCASLAPRAPPWAQGCPACAQSCTWVPGVPSTHRGAPCPPLGPGNWRAIPTYSRSFPSQYTSFSSLSSSGGTGFFPSAGYKVGWALGEFRGWRRGIYGKRGPGVAAGRGPEGNGVWSASRSQTQGRLLQPKLFSPT